MGFKVRIAIGTDHGNNLPLFYGKVDLVDGLKAPEMLGQIFDGEKNARLGHEVSSASRRVEGSNP